MKSIRNSSRFFGIIVVLIVMVLASGCKSKKKALEASRAAAERARIEQEATTRKQQEEDQRKKEADEKAKRDAEAKDLAAKANAPKARLGQYFDAISNADNVSSANSSINEALAMFASPDTPVLIVISDSNGQKDYDRPTTIREYLNYLKDQKKNANKISDVKVDGSGKITEVELRKPL